MTDFERDLRREGRALGPKGTYLVDQYGTANFIAIVPDRAWELRTAHATREAAIAWCLKYAGVSRE